MNDIQNQWISKLYPKKKFIVCKLSDNGNLLAFDGADNQLYIYNIPEKKIVK